MAFTDSITKSDTAGTEEALDEAAAEAKRETYVTRAVAQVVAENPSPGRVYTHSEIALMLGIGKPKASVAAFQKYQIGVMKWLDTLLTDHQVYLANVHGEGYRVVASSEQASCALVQMRRDLVASLTRARKVIVNTDDRDFTPEDAVRHADALCKHDMLAGSIRGATKKWST